jgi:glycosyltransferase involved in cell wall biosynthesis
LITQAKKHIEDIFVVDDGSTDETAASASRAGAIVHRLQKNQGKGEALKAGFQYAISQQREWVLTMDSDGQHAPDDIPKFLSLLGRYDMILGNRMEESHKVPWLRRLGNLTSSLIVSLTCFQRIYDSQTGFRAYRTDLLRRIELESSNYDLETEVIIKAARQGFRIGHCRIQTIYAGEVSRFKNVRDSLRFLTVIMRSFFWW